MRIMEMEHHIDTNQPSNIATSSIKHLISAKAALILDYVSSQQHYCQQAIQKQGTMEEPLLSSAGITFYNTILSSSKEIHREVSSHNIICSSKFFSIILGID